MDEKINDLKEMVKMMKLAFLAAKMLSQGKSVEKTLDKAYKHIKKAGEVLEDATKDKVKREDLEKMLGKELPL